MASSCAKIIIDKEELLEDVTFHLQKRNCYLDQLCLLRNGDCQSRRRNPEFRGLQPSEKGPLLDCVISVGLHSDEDDGIYKPFVKSQYPPNVRNEV